MLYTTSGAVPALKRWVKSKPRLASLAFDIWNANYFGRLQIHEKMLADRMRVENYYNAISKHVREGDVVVDLGHRYRDSGFLRGAEETGESVCH